jgi:hypothetical protein
MQRPWQQIHCRNGSSYQPKCPCGWQGRRVSGREAAEKQADKHGPSCGYGDD